MLLEKISDIWMKLKLVAARLSEGDGDFYINGPDTLPPPLSAREEAEVIKSLDTDPDSRRILIEHNLRLVAHVVKKYYASREDQDDLVSIGTIGLIKAVSTFKPDKNTRLATYACRCIENAILSQWNNRRLRWRNGCLLRQNGACWREWESAAIF